MRCATPFSKIFHSLDKAQHECIRNDNCSAVYGRSGNVFEHTRFNLCHKGNSYSVVKSLSVKGVKGYHPKLPDSLYMKPGTVLSITNYVEIPKIYHNKSLSGHFL